MENNENLEQEQEQSKVEQESTQTTNNSDAPKTVNCSKSAEKPKKPIYKKWWFWVIIGVIIISLIGGGSDDSNKTDSGSNGDTNNSSDNNNSNNNNNTTKCTHSYEIISSEATCTSGGYETSKCSLCGDTKKQYKSSLGHTTQEGICSRCKKSFGTWKMSFYVDEFDNPTNEAYITNSDVFVGTFSNSATTDSKLYARILIDENRVSIKLWEYGSVEVNAYSTTKYKITILDESGTKHYTTGTMYENGERIRLEDWTLVSLLQNNSQIKVYIEEDSKYGYHSTYLFTVKNGNFNSVYSEFYSTYIN